jgi:hypothetical protein
MVVLPREVMLFSPLLFLSLFSRQNFGYPYPRKEVRMGPRKKGNTGGGQTLANEFDEDETLEDENMSGVPWARDVESNSDPDSIFERDPDVVHELGCDMGEDCVCAEDP